MALLADWRKPRLMAIRPPIWAQHYLADGQNIWDNLRFLGTPDTRQVVREFEGFTAALVEFGVELQILDCTDGLSPDAVYVRDAVCLSPNGLVACSMTKPNRHNEPADLIRQLAAGGHSCAGAIQPPGFLEGGDVVWAADDHCLVGLSHRSNEEGIRQFRAICGDDVKLNTFDLPNEQGAGHVFHLSSIVSMLSSQKCLVHSRYLPISLIRKLEKLGIGVVEIADEDATTLGANVLVIDQDTVLAVAGSAQTSARLRTAGIRVVPFLGDNLCILGQGGPTCLTRPIVYW